MLNIKRHKGHLDGPIRLYPRWEINLGLFRIDTNYSDTNYHGPNRQSIKKGWRFHDLVAVNGGRYRVKAYRIIKYHRSGAWSYIDVSWMRRHDK